MINNELWRECFGKVNVPMLVDASRLALQTYAMHLQNKILKESDNTSDNKASGEIFALISELEDVVANNGNVYQMVTKLKLAAQKLHHS